MIRLESVSKTYRSGDEVVSVLESADFTLPDGAFYAIVGPSGSGKSTLLNLTAGIDVPNAGRVLVDGIEVSAMEEDMRTRWRGRNVAFVFQDFHLVPSLTVEENVDLPVDLNALERRFDTEAILGRVGLSGKERRYPFELSGGERQRLAIARAFVADVPYLFMDEPTGNLDRKNADRIMDLVGELRGETGISILAITHDAAIANRADARFRVEGGRVWAIP